MAIGLRMRRRAVPYYAAGSQNVDPFAKAFAECHRQTHGALLVLLNRVVNAYVGACDFAQLKVLFGRCTRDDGGTKQLSLLDDANARGKARVVATLLPFFCSVVNTVRERHKVFISVAKLVGILTHEYNMIRLSTSTCDALGKKKLIYYPRYRICWACARVVRNQEHAG